MYVSPKPAPLAPALPIPAFPIKLTMEPAKARYVMHGLRVAVETQSQRLLEVFDSFLGPYAGAGNGGDGLRVSLHSGQPSGAFDPGLRNFWTGTLPDGSSMSCRTGPGRRQFEIPERVRADLDLAEGTARIVVHPETKTALLETCLLPLLCDWLGQGGHHVIHAASLFVEHAGQRRAVIVSGMSGAGKTTLALALAGAGWGLLADDMTFYQAGAGNLPGQVWGIRARCKVCPGSLDLLPWLSKLPVRSAGVNGERFLDSRPLGPQTTSLTATPGLLLFLNPRNPAAHRLEPMDKLSALTRLTRENVRAFEKHPKAAASRAFAALAELVRTSRTFQASLCPRLEELPARLASLW